MKHDPFKPLGPGSALPVANTFGIITKEQPELSKNNWVPWHESGQPTRRVLGSTVPCDMWTGPCSCGDWHTEGK